MSAADRAWRLLLRSYPPAFRAVYAREMTLLFHDRRRESAGRSVRFWCEIVGDVVRSAPALRLEALAARRGHTQLTERTMKPMAILAMVVGTYGAAGALSEGYLGGVARHSGISLAAGAIGAVAGALLVAAAVAMLRRTPRATAFASGAAVACLAAYAIIGAATPRLSHFSMLLGIGFPVVLLAYLHRTGGRPMTSGA